MEVEPNSDTEAKYLPNTSYTRVVSSISGSRLGSYRNFLLLAILLNLSPNRGASENRDGKWILSYAIRAPFSGMVQSEVTPPIVAGVCDPGVPRTAGLTEASYNAGPTAARDEKPARYPKTAAIEPCPFSRPSEPSGPNDVARVLHFREQNADIVTLWDITALLNATISRLVARLAADCPADLASSHAQLADGNAGARIWRPKMDDPEQNSEDRQTSNKQRRPRLLERAMRERWAIPGSLRQPLVDRLGEIIRDPEAPHRDVLSAVSAILTASKINLANIALTIKVQVHEELEERMTEIERKLEARLGKKSGPG
jgi:hypothetical protein